MTRIAKANRTWGGCPISRLIDIFPDDWELVSEDFKDGDYIVIQKSAENWNEKMDEYIGDVIQLNKSSKSGSFRIRHFTFNFNQGHFRLATQEEIDSITPTAKPCVKRTDAASHYFYKLLYAFSSGGNTRKQTR